MRSLNGTKALVTVMAAAMIAMGFAHAVPGSERGITKHNEEEPPLLQIVAQHVVLPPNNAALFDEQHFIVQCPLGHVPTRYSITGPHDNDFFYAQTGARLIDSSKRPVDLAELERAPHAYPILSGAGYDIGLASVGEARRSTWHLELVLSCLSYGASTPDFKLLIAKSKATVATTSYMDQIAYCPADYPVAVGGFTNSNVTLLRDVLSMPAWGTSSSPILLRDLDDGPMGPPTGWQSSVVNRYGPPVEATAYALCARASSLQAFISSTPVVAGVNFSTFAPVPDTWMMVGGGVDPGTDGVDKGFDVWMQDGTVVNFEAWYPTSTNYYSEIMQIRAYIAQGVGGRIDSSRPPQRTGRAVTAVLAIPQDRPQPAAIVVDVIEFYHAALDHYFITSIEKEIRDLDSGVQKGWVRTGQSFKAYGLGSGGPMTRRPVCRAYGKPEAKLNSHFYSASHTECFATLANFNGDWEHEASEVFQVELPDRTTGMCPSGGMPVYRTWNNRADSNHRYTTSKAIRDQMIAQGHVAEGYGPDGVALCALQ